jgi:eukaryotic-like serine/threonine-protein kinase
MATIVGKTLLNQFQVDAFIATGGMGAVYRVWDLKRDTPLAMKVLHSELADDPSIFKRFRREANALKKLAHPNIVPFYGLYQTPDLIFLLERFVDGPSMGEILKQKQGKPLSVSEALPFLKALCAALGYAHSNGVVHCDVKPGNVMVDHGGNIYLTDFGIARHAESTTTTMGVAGTAAYMAPEQIRGAKVSPATDIYALGVVLFEMLTGQKPFRGNESGTEKSGQTANERIRYGQLNLAPPDPQSLNPAISNGMSVVMLKALSKESAERFPTTQALFAAVCQEAGTVPAAVPDCTDLKISTGEENIPDKEMAAPIAETPLAKLRVTIKRLPSWAVAAIVLVGGILIVSAGAGIASLVKRTPTPDTAATTPGNIQPAAMALETETPLPSPTATIVLTPTDTVPPPTPTRGIGTTWTRPKDGMVMMFVPAGEFSMGTNEASKNANPEHRVKMDDYWIDQTDVTNAMFQKFIGETGLKTDAQKKTFGQVFQNNNSYSTVYGATWDHPRGPKNTFQGLDHPVVQVSWNDAEAYCKWAQVSLPTEAQWEKAARGIDGRNYPWTGSGFGPDKLNYGDENFNKWLSNNVPHWGKPGNDGYTFTSPVGNYPAGASPYRVMDMVGNVMQWVSDYYQANYFGQKDLVNPEGPAPNGTVHVYRGGWWSKTEDGNNTYTRYGNNAIYTTDFLGFRCATTVLP